VERVWETHAEGPTGNILLWHRFWVQGRYTQSPSVAMLLELRGRMFKGKDDAALVVMLAPYAGTSSDGAAAALQDFLSGSGPALDALLIGTAARP
jgi:EpsI family protein